MMMRERGADKTSGREFACGRKVRFVLTFGIPFCQENLGAVLRRSLSAIEKNIKQTKNVSRPIRGYERNDDLLAGERY